MNYFIASSPKNRGTQDLICFRIKGDLDETLYLPFLNGAAHSAHRMFRSQCSAPSLPNFGVRHSASAERPAEP